MCIYTYICIFNMCVYVYKNGGRPNALGTKILTTLQYYRVSTTLYYSSTKNALFALYVHKICSMC